MESFWRWNCPTPCTSHSRTLKNWRQSRTGSRPRWRSGWLWSSTRCLTPPGCWRSKLDKRLSISENEKFKFLPKQLATTKAKPCWPTVFPAPIKDSDDPTVSRKMPNGTKKRISEVISPRNTLGWEIWDYGFRLEKLFFVETFDFQRKIVRNNFDGTDFIFRWNSIKFQRKNNFP